MGVFLIPHFSSNFSRLLSTEQTRYFVLDTDLRFRKCTPPVSHQRHSLMNDALISAGSIMFSAILVGWCYRCIHRSVSPDPWLPARDYQTGSTVRARSSTRDGLAATVSIGPPTAPAFGAGTTTRRYDEPLASTLSPLVGFRNGTRLQC